MSLLTSAGERAKIKLDSLPKKMMNNRVLVRVGDEGDGRKIKNTELDLVVGGAEFNESAHVLRYGTVVMTPEKLIMQAPRSRVLAVTVATHGAGESRRPGRVRRDPHPLRVFDPANRGPGKNGSPIAPGDRRAGRIDFPRLCPHGGRGERGVWGDV